MVNSVSEAQYRAHQAAASVTDPELPFITVEELGILRAVRVEKGIAVARIAPTYSGCPAQAVIELSLVTALNQAGFEGRVERQLEPAWTTDWITPEGCRKLRRHGISPPVQAGKTVCGLFESAANPECPLCGSQQSERVSEFGSTACKAVYRCRSCAEPFEYFKPI
ncbi:MAG: phenylacetate-CoA oxygenase subunit PaaJ [Rhodobacteraceae bacterium]|nr:phenylacetate-CoA oxygenase subunit PaaJ [Paracoccaceae bacterium]